jgi:magnesium-transporting ATPase (P-type)
MSGLLILLGTTFVFVVELEDGEVSKRDTTMTFTTFVLFDLFNALACRHNSRPVYELQWNSNSAFLIAVFLSLLGQIAVIYFAPLQKVFRTVALSLQDMIFIVCLASSMLVLDTIRKKCFPGVFAESIATTTAGGDGAGLPLMSWNMSAVKKKELDDDDDDDEIKAQRV